MDKRLFSETIRKLSEDSGRSLKFIQNVAATANKSLPDNKKYNPLVLNGMVQMEHKKHKDFYKKEVNRNGILYGRDFGLLIAYLRTLLKTQTKEQILDKIDIVCMSFAIRNGLSGISKDILASNGRMALSVISETEKTPNQKTVDI